MTNFKVGDRVRLKSGNTFSNGEYICDIREIRGAAVYFEGGTLCNFKQLELAYPNPPHKHRDLIIEWVNGAEIQVIYDGKWVDQTHPDWENSLKYRVKPQKPEKDLEIEAIQKQMDELKERLENLKGEQL